MSYKNILIENMNYWAYRALDAKRSYEDKTSNWRKDSAYADWLEAYHKYTNTKDCLEKCIAAETPEALPKIDPCPKPS